MRTLTRLAVALLLLIPGHAMAAVDGHALHIGWGVPFIGVLLSLALLPLLRPSLWEKHYGTITAGWTLAFFVPFTVVFGVDAALVGLAHAMLAEYLPFIILLTALFTVSGGIYVRGNLRGTPSLNTGILAIGAGLASFMGTTGAAMLLIRPLIRANDNRPNVAHVVIFFIFIVANIGGSLTPLGDPPLFLGFLKGVGFFWTAQHIILETLFLVVVLLVLFYILDTWHFRKYGTLPHDPTPDTGALRIEGGRNFLLLAGVVGLVLMSGIWKPGIEFEVQGTRIGLPGLVRDLGLIAITFVSWRLTPAHVHEANHFSWEPMLEVGKLFGGIFLTIIPVIAMLQAGPDGPFGAVVRMVSGPEGEPVAASYFWVTGLLSSVLDNAPTYLVFFNTAGGDANQLMGPLADTLTAISAGAVFMGAITYIGNAPNLMVKAIADERGVRMPSFFGYMLWSCGILIPLFLILDWLFLR